MTSEQSGSTTSPGWSVTVPVADGAEWDPVDVRAVDTTGPPSSPSSPAP